MSEPDANPRLVAEARAYVEAHRDRRLVDLLVFRLLEGAVAVLDAQDAEIASIREEQSIRDNPPKWENDAVETVARLRDTIKGQGLSMAAMSKEARERDAEIAKVRRALEQRWAELQQALADIARLKAPNNKNLLPDCMMPDGGDPCLAFQELRAEVDRLSAPPGADVQERAFRALGYTCEFTQVAEDPAHFDDVFAVARALQQYGDERAREARAAAIEEPQAMIFEKPRAISGAVFA